MQPDHNLLGRPVILTYFINPFGPHILIVMLQCIDFVCSMSAVLQNFQIFKQRVTLLLELWCASLSLNMPVVRAYFYIEAATALKKYLVRLFYNP